MTNPHPSQTNCQLSDQGRDNDTYEVSVPYKRSGYLSDADIHNFPPKSD